jgi:hypothetical protein
MEKSVTVFPLNRHPGSLFWLLSVALLSLSLPGQAENLRQQGQWYGYWGWNNATYSDSDIHFHGDDHDFTLHNVRAKDHQTSLGGEIFHSYLNPGRMTIPQYDWRVGYFVMDNWSVSLGFDHMKYVMVQDQTVTMTGTISRPGFERTDPSAAEQKLTDDFLTYEHTDGFNMISLETERYLPLFAIGTDFDLAVFAGGGAGILFPKSNVKLLSGERNDEWHVAGHATVLKIGVEATLWHNWFLRFLGKYGYADMNDVLTSNRGDKADQKFYFDEYIGALGYRF